MTHPWPHDDLRSDFQYALDAWGGTRSIGVPGEPLPHLTEGDVAEVVRWYVSYHGYDRWQPGDDTGTELTLAAVLRLHDGRWASVVAWNDYTGWGCQDGADIRIGATVDEVVAQGLDQESRVLLGYEAAKS